MEGDPAYDISIAHPDGHTAVDEGPIRSAIETTLRRHQTLSARLGVALVDDTRMAALNKTYLGHEGPTDVLTFDLRDDTQQKNGHRAHLAIDAEIVLSVDAAAREAAHRHHGIDAELALYAIHGTLHLLGYDDHSTTGAAEMHCLEDEILSSVGIGPTYRGVEP